MTFAAPRTRSSTQPIDDRTSFTPRYAPPAGIEEHPANARKAGAPRVAGETPELDDFRELKLTIG